MKVDVALYCPDCGRKVVTIKEAPHAATEVRRRKCRGCGEDWSIVFRPIGHGEGIRTDEVTWARFAQVAEEQTDA